MAKKHTYCGDKYVAPWSLPTAACAHAWRQRRFDGREQDLNAMLRTNYNQDLNTFLPSPDHIRRGEERASARERQSDGDRDAEMRGCVAAGSGEEVNGRKQGRKGSRDGDTAGDGPCEHAEWSAGARGRLGNGRRRESGAGVTSCSPSRDNRSKLEKAHSEND